MFMQNFSSLACTQTDIDTRHRQVKPILSIFHMWKVKNRFRWKILKTLNFLKKETNMDEYRHALRQFRWNVNIDLPSYEDRCRVLVMDTLKKRRDVARVLLVFDLLSGKIDSPKLLSQINLSVPSYQTRGREFLSSIFTERIMGFMNLYQCSVARL
jgi:hypothetical protein